ncbi:hypothetical protein PV10_02956 [Exophiala mesophila]|uniref:NAD(P)-binding protein n=1 Tax=Exophiala mesophila TaxID=212818 RepID=A0A0D2A8G4_EXOME|nr:uncharacterized protein PV10_02956 [Exophiala mesophila]KIV95283.1 hypothetical protein PV10_02956 [Exophiala mesophila]
MFASLRAFWSQSFNLPAPPLTEKNLPDQKGKVYLITGSNTGVGYQVASILYSHNAKVYVAARTESKALAAIDSITKLHPKSTGSLHYLHLDLSDLSTIKASADDFLARETKLHWLNNNAGIMTPALELKGAQGMDLSYQTNILGPFLFTKLLLPVLQKTAASEPAGSVRVSWAGSLATILLAPNGGHTWKKGKDGLDELDDTIGKSPIYGTTKSANFYLGHEFARRNPRDKILHTTYNPGNLASDLARHVSSIQRFFIRGLLYAPIFGAYTEIYSGLSPDLTIEKDQGGFIIPWGRRGSVRPDQLAELEKGEQGEAAKLYDWCERVTKQYQ